MQPSGSKFDTGGGFESAQLHPTSCLLSLLQDCCSRCDLTVSCPTAKPAAFCHAPAEPLKTSLWDCEQKETPFLKDLSGHGVLSQ